MLQIPTLQKCVMTSPINDFNQPENIVFLSNLDKGIRKDYLYHFFRQTGEILFIKVQKNGNQKQWKQYASIGYDNPISALKAVQLFDNQILIKNVIRVKPFCRYQSIDKEGNIFISNLPEDAFLPELNAEFSRYGSIISIDIHKTHEGKQLHYGYVQFQKKEDADKFLERIIKHPIIYKGNVLKIELFKDKSVRKEKPNSIYFRAFSSPLTLNQMNNEKLIKAIEYGWSLIIKDYLITAQGDSVKECFVKIDDKKRQPWAIIVFNIPEEAQKNLDICKNQGLHPCVKSCAHHAIELIKRHGTTTNSDGSLAFTIEDIIQNFEEFGKDPNDIFKGSAKDFYYNFNIGSKHNKKE